jgi:sterol desaturase/sphingolipid hydroxylase (fatty acid hydroxylase superfamily)
MASLQTFLESSRFAALPIGEWTSVTIKGVLFSVLGSCLVAEFAGYWLHRLLHSDKVPFLSRGHLIHHFLIYAPNQPMRHHQYLDATDNRFSVGNVGLEWLVPSAAILAFSWFAMFLVRVPGPYQVLVLLVLIAWPIFTFNYLHDRMHLSDFWMTRAPVLRWWFLRARRLHDIHHHSVNDFGRMDSNFGIGFYWFDRVFRTLARKHRPFNRQGFEAAKDRYELVEKNGKLVPSTDLMIFSHFSEGDE